MTPPKDAAERKALPITSGVLDYFPDALLEVARCSKVGNDQHNPGQPLHWAKEKSTDEADALVRHLIERGTRDTDGVLHSAKVAWRALAMLQRELENDAAEPVDDDFPEDQLSPRAMSEAWMAASRHFNEAISRADCEDGEESYTSYEGETP